MQLRYIAGVEHYVQLFIALLNREIGYDGLPLGLIDIAGKGIGGFLVQMNDLLNRGLESFFGALQPLDDLIEMVLGETLEMLAENPVCQIYTLRRSLFALDLQLPQQTFL